MSTEAVHGKNIDSMANFHTHYTVVDDKGHYEHNVGFKQSMAEYAEAGYDIIMHSSQADWYDNSQAAQEVGITSISGQEHVLQYDGVLLVCHQAVLRWRLPGRHRRLCGRGRLCHHVPP